MKRIYITGPDATGSPDALEAYTAAQVWIEARGDEAVNPYLLCDQLPRLTPGWAEMNQAQQRRKIINQRIQQLPFCDELFVLEGWEDSPEATLEVHVAFGVGMGVRFQRPEGVP